MAVKTEIGIPNSDFLNDCIDNLENWNFLFSLVFDNVLRNDYSYDSREDWFVDMYKGNVHSVIGDLRSIQKCFDDGVDIDS